MKTREEMLLALEEILDFLATYDRPLPGDIEDRLKDIKAALEAEPTCACGDREPFDVWDGWLGGNQAGGYPLAKTRYYDSDVPVRVIVLKLPILPAKEEAAR